MDRIPMVNVSARILDQNGKAVPRARITMRLTTLERYCGLIVPRETSGYTDADGNAVLRVWPNELGSEGSEYKVSISYGEGCNCNPCGKTGTTPAMSRSFYVVVPNADCNLFDITNLPPYEQRGSGAVITTEVAAYASQAANAAKSAESVMDAVDAMRADIVSVADRAEAAKDAACAAATAADGHEQRAKRLADGIDAKSREFEAIVVERTERTAQRLVADARNCVRQAESSALLAIEQRSGEALTEIAQSATAARVNAVEAVNNAREDGIEAIKEATLNGIDDLKEIGCQFEEDFQNLTERAETAARRAGCSAAAAQNAATKACLCADRAEKAAIGVEEAKGAAEIAAAAAKEAHACAHADAICAENAATNAHIDAARAEASAKAAEKSAEVADCCAKNSCKCAEAASEMRDAVAADREYIDGAVPRVAEALAEKEERLAAIEQRQDEAGENLDMLENRMAGFEGQVKRQADRACREANRAEAAAERAENTLSYVRGDNLDFSWVLPAGAEAGETLDLPGQYVAGSNSLRLFFGGMLMARNAQYRECGKAGELSGRVELLCRLPENAQMSMWVAGARVTGDLDACAAKAAEIVDRLNAAEERAESAVAGLAGTLAQITEAGTIQAERAREQADRAEAEADKVGSLVRLAQGSNLEGSWVTAGDAPAGTLLTLPVTFIGGRNSLRLFYGGMLMSRGIHYEEIGETDAISRHVKLLMELPAGSQMNAWSVATGASVDMLHDKLAQATELLERAQIAVKEAEEARDKAIAAAQAAVTGTIATVPDQETIKGSNDGFFIIDPDMAEETQP